MTTSLPYAVCASLGLRVLSMYTLYISLGFPILIIILFLNKRLETQQIFSSNHDQCRSEYQESKMNIIQEGKNDCIFSADLDLAVELFHAVS